MKHIFIVNPVSGKGHSLNFIPYIKEYFADKKDEYEIIETEYPKHATEIAKRYTKEDDVCLYTVGGDGTMKEVLDGINEGVTLCVIPGGTGNDFYKTVDRRKISEKQILFESIEGEVVDCDYGILNGTSKFLNIISFGIDAEVNVYACDVLKVKYKLPGSVVYAIAAFSVALHPKTYHMEMTVDDKKMEEDIVMVALTNGRYYGGGFLPSPKASLTDGLFDNCYFKGPLSSLQVIGLILKYMKGKHLSDPRCGSTKGKHYHFKFNDEITYQIDGENLKIKEADIQMIPAGMKIKMPKERKLED